MSSTSLRQLLFGADFHLGANQYGMPQREQDYERAFNEFFENTLALPNTDCVLLGDTGEIPNERRATIHRIRTVVERVTQAGRKVYYIRGNHDCASPSLAVAIGLPGFIDAEVAFFDALAAGQPFQPYGVDGPKVCALHSEQVDTLWAKLREIRERELPENRSTELWLHQAIRPGAGTAMAELDVVDLINFGWHTVLAGDIHNGGMWQVSAADPASGMLAYPGSPEMTDINEYERPRSFLLHRPCDAEPQVNIHAFAQVPYQHRPYKTFDMEGQRSDEQVAFVRRWIDDTTSATGLKPIVRVRSPDPSWRNHRDIAPFALKMMYERPKIEEAKMVLTAPAELLPTGEIGGGNESVYGSASGPGTVFQKLQRVLTLSELPPDVKHLGGVVLAHPDDPKVWEREAEAAAT